MIGSHRADDVPKNTYSTRYRGAADSNPTFGERVAVSRGPAFTLGFSETPWPGGTFRL